MITGYEERKNKRKNDGSRQTNEGIRRKEDQKDRAKKNKV